MEFRKPSFLGQCDSFSYDIATPLFIPVLGSGLLKLRRHSNLPTPACETERNASSLATVERTQSL
jgi:hypothetical protein